MNKTDLCDFFMNLIVFQDKTEAMDQMNCSEALTLIRNEDSHTQDRSVGHIMKSGANTGKFCE